MPDHQDKIKQLLEKVESLLKRQDAFTAEIQDLRAQIFRLKASGEDKPLEANNLKDSPIEDTLSQATAHKTPQYREQEHGLLPQQAAHAGSNNKRSLRPGVNFEKFIGENLINKIGIAITVFGVAIGAKYSIENELISPLTRIILGYLSGTGLLLFGIKLKKNYKNYSAVLVSGAIAILYFITYAAYNFYGLYPQGITFTLLLIFTAFGVITAIKYNNQVIAHIGLVGAYAVPFLLSEGSGKVEILFSYMAIINTGILVIAFKKYWKPLLYSSFIFTWIIFLYWYNSVYQNAEHIILMLGFLTVFFIIFYTSFLAYKLIQKEKYNGDDVLLLLLNSFIFFGLGYYILSDHPTGKELLGIFTLGNAALHFAVSVLIYRQKLADSNLFYLVSGLVLVFLTLTIPIQLEGNWVTILWAGEAALLFWIGRSKKVPVYEKLAYPLFFLAFFSLLQDWSGFYGSYIPEQPETNITPFLNTNFLTSLFFITAFAFINYLSRNTRYPSPLNSANILSKFVSYSIPALLLLVCYFSIRLEIANYWDQLIADSYLSIPREDQMYPVEYYNYDLHSFKTLWILNYSLLFVTVIAFLNLKKIKNRELGKLNLALIIVAIAVFLIQGLYVMSELRASYMDQPLAEYYRAGNMHLWIRYISFAFVGIALLAFYKYLQQDFIKDLSEGFDRLLHVSLLWIASSELIHWLEILDYAQSYKLGLSILWGMWSLLLIAVGIWKNKKHLRIDAFILFAITLLKLFFYDISHLNTISKTIVLVSLGVLLLIISFLYNKYKHIITVEHK